jgi:hypothetical protein
VSDSFHIDFPDLPEFTTALNAAPEILRAELTTAARTISLHGESLSKSYAPIATGNAMGSVYSKAESGAGGVSAIWGATAEYAYYADQGRGPGKMPPKGALVGWKGVTEENEFVIRRAIGLHGTKGKPFVTRAFNEIKGGFALQQFSDAIKRALAKIGGH